MKSRRDFLKHAFLVMGGISMPGLVPSLKAAQAQVARTPVIGGGARAPMRFIFMHRSNGLFPKSCVPLTLGPEEKAKEDRNAAFEVDLAKHTLPEWMAPLEQYKSHLTILQGISGKMCAGGHHPYSSALGAYKATDRPGSIRWATVDFELAKLFPSPLGHLELACLPSGAGVNGIAPGFSARGPQLRNFAFGSPAIAVSEIFKSVATGKAEQLEYQLQRKVLEFAASHESGLAQHLAGIEQMKVGGYSDSIQEAREQDRKIDLMADVVRQHVPKLESKYLANDINTFDRQFGHVEVMLASMVSGLTNVVAFTVDELSHLYTGVPGLEGEVVDLHGIGHNKPVGGVAPLEVRKRCDLHHMDLIVKIVNRLKAVPEGAGTMFDNTMITYFPDNGEKHHGVGTEYPMIIMAGSNIKPNLGSRYIRLPYWGTEGHKTLGNWYTTLLNLNGNPIKHYGEIDPTLKIKQLGPISQFMS